MIWKCVWYGKSESKSLFCTVTLHINNIPRKTKLLCSTLIISSKEVDDTATQDFFT